MSSRPTRTRIWQLQPSRSRRQPSSSPGRQAQLTHATKGYGKRRLLGAPIASGRGPSHDSLLGGGGDPALSPVTADLASPHRRLRAPFSIGISRRGGGGRSRAAQGRRNLGSSRSAGSSIRLPAWGGCLTAWAGRAAERRGLCRTAGPGPARPCGRRPPGGRSVESLLAKGRFSALWERSQWRVNVGMPSNAVVRLVPVGPVRQGCLVFRSHVSLCRQCVIGTVPTVVAGGACCLVAHRQRRAPAVSNRVTTTSGQPRRAGIFSHSMGDRQSLV